MVNSEIRENHSDTMEELSFNLDEDEVSEQAQDIEEQPEDGLIQKKRGRSQSSIWAIFTDDVNPQKVVAAKCKHCNMIVRYHKKSEQVITHMRRCAQFINLMKNTNPQDRPDWYESKKRSKDQTTTTKNFDLNSNFRSCENTSSTSQSCIRQFAIPRLTKAEQRLLYENIALHFYITGTAFQRIEQHHLLKAFQICRPDIKLPDRQLLAGSLLDTCYDKLKERIDKQLTLPETYICLTSVARSNVCNDPVVNYMATSSTFTVFLESVNTGEQSHHADWIASDITRVLNSIKSTTCGVCTDNTTTNRAAWKILGQKFPTKFFYGCVSHGLHLLVKNIFAATKTKRNGSAVASYPENYPFEYLLHFTNDCKSVVSFFHNHHAVKAKLDQEQDQKKVKRLVAPAPTRWGTIEQCFKRLLESDKIINALVNDRDFICGSNKQKEQRQRIKDIVTNDYFAASLKKGIALCAPIEKWLRYFQNDSASLSEVYHMFLQLPNDLKKVEGLTELEKEYLADLVRDRFKFMYSAGHGMAYVLDPRYVGEGIRKDQPEVWDNLEQMIYSFPPNDEDPTTEQRKEILYQELTAYIIDANRQKSLNTFKFQMLERGTKTPIQYWQTDGSKYPNLQQVAMRVLSLVPSSASSERNFSTFGFIHSKLRNKLSPEKAMKLVYIKTNYNSFKEFTDLEEEEDDEEEAFNMQQLQ